MEHIVQFGVNIDDRAIEKAVIANAERKIIDDLEKAIANEFFERPYRSSFDRNSNFSDTFGLKRWAKDMFKEYLEDNKEVIIDKAIKELASNMSKTKVVKEKLNKILEDIND